MYKKSNRGFRKRKYKLKNNVMRSSFNTEEKSSVFLQVVRVITVIFFVAVIVTTITVGVSMYGSDNNFDNSSVYSSSAGSNNELLLVVNKSNPLDKSYVPDLTQKDNYSVSTFASESLGKLLKSAKNDGVDLKVNYAYVSYEDQEKAYKEAYNKIVKNKNYTQVTAQAKTQVVTPQAGRSEFQTGLLVSFTTDEKGEFKNSQASMWLERHSIDYGFILRYPPDKKDRTSMNTNYNAYRYVGENNALVIRSLDMCLDEYFNYINLR